MFTFIITSENNTIEMNFNDYTTSIGTFFTLLGTSCLQKETKDFTLTFNGYSIREVTLINGKVVYDDSMVEF